MSTQSHTWKFLFGGALLLTLTSPTGNSQLAEAEEMAGLSPLLAPITEKFQLRLPAAYQKDAPKLAWTIWRLSREYRIRPEMLLSLIDVESSFRYDAVSPAGAIGLMQIQPETAEYVARLYGVTSYRSRQDLFNPFVNLELGVIYLAHLQRRFGHKDRVLAAYNMGPTALRARMSRGTAKLGARGSYEHRVKGRSANLRRSWDLLQSAQEKQIQFIL